jgi:hypothetical protein
MRAFRYEVTVVICYIIAKAVALLQHIEQEVETSWKHYYHVFPNLIKTFNLKKGIEIGVSTGGHSHAILETTAVEKLYSIDPYTPNPTLNLWVDDYDTGFAGVPRAVNEFFNARNIKINRDSEQSRIWWIRKP